MPNKRKNPAGFSPEFETEFSPEFETEFPEEMLRILKDPQPHRDLMLVALQGGADVGNAGNHAIRNILRKSRAKPVAEINPDPFYIFGQKWPKARIREDHARVEWPRFRFHQTGKLTLAAGAEPQLRWQTFFNILTDLAWACGTRNIIQINALHATIPHTRPVRPRGMATNPELAGTLEIGCLAQTEEYTAPNLGLMEACLKRDMGYATICAYIPQYLVKTPNAMAARQLLQYLVNHLDISADLNRVNREAQEMERSLEQEMEQNPLFRQTVLELENSQTHMPLDPNAVLQDLEDFLRMSRDE